MTWLDALTARIRDEALAEFQQAYYRYVLEYGTRLDFTMLGGTEACPRCHRPAAHLGVYYVHTGMWQDESGRAGDPWSEPAEDEGHGTLVPVTYCRRHLPNSRWRFVRVVEE